jgi:hypothetical protein
MFATDLWPAVALSVTRNIRREMMPAMIDSGAVRADCWSMEGHHAAHRWLEVLGAVREATVEDYGPSRKPYHCYSWTRSRLERDGDFDHVHLRRLKAATDTRTSATTGGADTG